MTHHILSAYGDSGSGDQRVETAVNYFRNWNFIQSKDDVPTALFEVYFHHCMKNIFRDEMGDELFEQYIFLANIPYRVTAAMMNDTSNVWFDDVGTPVIETKNDIIRKSLQDAIADLTQQLGGSMKEWRWGRLHSLTLKHPFGDIGVLKAIFNIGPFETGGSGTTVNNGEYRFIQPYGMTLGPSMRSIVDFADLNRALSVIPSGQSGQPLHDHYSDQMPLWKNGEYHSMPIDESEILRISKNILYLNPVR